MVTIDEIREFAHDHFQSIIDHNELEMTGITSEHDIYLYLNALKEGIINGLIWAGETVKGIDKTLADGNYHELD